MNAVNQEFAEITTEKITYENWLDFDLSLRNCVSNSHLLETSNRLSDIFFDVEVDEDFITTDAVLDGIVMDGQLVGIFQKVDTLVPNGKMMEIGEILIHPDFQGKGIEKLLVNNIIEDSNCSSFIVFPQTEIEKNRYKKLGFLPMEEENSQLYKRMK